MSAVFGELCQIVLQNFIAEKARSASGYFGTVLYLFQKYCTKNNKEEQTLFFVWTGPPPVPLSANTVLMYTILPSRLVLLSAMVGVETLPILAIWFGGGGGGGWSPL